MTNLLGFEMANNLYQVFEIVDQSKIILFFFFRCNDDAIQSPVLFTDGPFSNVGHDCRMGLFDFLLPGPLLHNRTTRRLGAIQLERHFIMVL